MYFPLTAWQPMIIEILFTYHYITSIPVFWFVVKEQLFYIIYRKPTGPMWVIFILNTFFLGVCILLQCFNISITYMIGIAGTLFSFMIMYIFPSLMHLKCIDNQKLINEYKISLEGKEGEDVNPNIVAENLNQSGEQKVPSKQESSANI